MIFCITSQNVAPEFLCSFLSNRSEYQSEILHTYLDIT